MRFKTAGMAAAASVAGVVTAAASFARRVRRMEVTGESMRPALEPGDRVLVVGRSSLRRGDLVALADPREPSRTVIKRVAGLAPGGITVLGDNPGASTDSRHFGPVPADAVKGRAVYRYFPAHRRGRLGLGL